MSTTRPCDGQPRVCPGQCNPRNRNNETRLAKVLPCHQENVLNHSVYYQPEFSLFSRKTQTEQQCGDGGAGALNPEDRQFVESLTRRLEARRRARSRGRVALLRKLLVFFAFFFVHGCIAALARNYSHYQTFLATQFCGFITIMFWDDPT